MKVVIAIDSFKGSASSLEVGSAAKEGVLKVYPNADVKVVPVADGGEGTVDALIDGMAGKRVNVKVKDPLNRDIEVYYGILEESKTAIMEMAKSSGITLVKPEERNPLNTTTYGVGEMIKDAINKGCREFVIGIGGSATNDAGVGMLQALGYEFYDKDNNLVGLGGKVLEQITKVVDTNALRELKDCTFKIACDVNNPLFGTNGAAHIYGPQKGATPQIVEQLDKGLISFSNVIKKELNQDIANYPGVGAAGGLGYAFKGFLNANLIPGIDLIMDATNVESHIKGANFVITGEGRLDNQTVMQKAPIGITKLANKHNVKVVAVAGCVTDQASVCNDEGMTAFFPIINRSLTLEEAMDVDRTIKNTRNTVVQIFRLIKALT